MNTEGKKRKLVITGASGGIGLETVYLLSDRGFALHLVDLPDRGLAELAGKVGASYGEIRGHDLKSVENSLPAEKAPLGGLVHLAGAMTDDPNLARDDVWKDMMQSNLENAYTYATLVGEQLVEDGEGRIIFTSSLAFRRGAVDAVAYSAAKAGLVGLTRALARRFKTKATVNAIAPGIIKTNMPKRVIEKRGDILLGEIPLGRFGEPADVAKVIAFFAGKDSEYITGQCLNVDGGQMMN